MFLTLTAMTLLSMYTYASLNPENKICHASELSSVSGDGVMLSERVRLSVKQSNEHVLMLAPSGAGKSRKFIMQNVNHLKDCSLVVTDPAGEIEATCNTDKRVIVFNPFRKDTVGYDPLSNCRNEFEVRKIAKVILTNGMSKTKEGRQQEWVDMATPLLTAYMLMNYHTRKYSFGQLIKNVCTMPVMPVKSGAISLLQEVEESKIESAITEFRIFLQVMGAIQTLSSIRIVLNTCLQVFLDENVQHVLCRPNLNLASLRDEESILYIQIPERHSEYYAPLTATLCTQLIDALLDKPGLQTYFLFDEFSNIGTIPDVCKLLATARKHNVSIVAAIQSLTQLTRVYGEIEGKELHELFKCITVSSGLKDSAEYVSNLLGMKTVVGNGTSRQELLMTADKIRRMRADEMLIVCNNKRPVVDRMMPVVA